MSKSLSNNKKLILFALIFASAYFIPFDNAIVTGAITEAFIMLSDYAREHVLLCLVPAFFIAGAITVFLNQQAVIKYLGPKSNKFIAYSVASSSVRLSGTYAPSLVPSSNSIGSAK